MENDLSRYLGQPLVDTNCSILVAFAINGEQGVSVYIYIYIYTCICIWAGRCVVWLFSELRGSECDSWDVI